MPNQFSEDRRGFLGASIAATALLAALTPRALWARGRPAALDAWARDLIALNRSLAGNEIDAEAWQIKIEALKTSVSVADLVRYLDVDALIKNFKYASNLADFADPHLPPDIMALAGAPPRHWFIRVFAMRKGGAVIPHVHNRMASAHLVISGAFRVRTHDRVEDVSDAVILKPTRDETYGAGQILSMSEVRDNQHWLVALEGRSMTLDVGVVDTSAMRQFKLPANENHMIFVDADRKPESSGLVVAPIMSFEACAKKYADWPS